MKKKEKTILRNKMKKINKILVLIVLCIYLQINLYALKQDKILDTMKYDINQVTTILQEQNITKEQKANQIFNMLDEIFDYKLMSKISLGRVFKKLSKEQKNKFTIAFTNKLKLSYMNKLNLYTDQKTKIKELKQTKKTRMILYTDLIGEESVFAINYKFYKNKQNDWLIYDVELLGVSILQTYRKQFKEYLRNHTIDDLTKNM